MAGDREPSLDSSFVHGIMAVRDFSQLENLGAFYSYAKKHFNERSITNVLAFRGLCNFTDPQSVAVAITLPVHLDPRNLYPFLKSIVTKDRTALLPASIRTNLTTRFVQCAICGDRAVDLYRDGVIQELHHKNGSVFQLPFLMLTAYAYPVNINPVLTGYRRLDCITLYYSGVNKLLARKFDQADQDLIYSWELSKAAKDIRRDIISAMSLSALLSRKSWDIFISRLPKKHVPSAGYVFRIWSLDEPIGAGLSALYARFAGELQAEHGRRVLLDAATVARVIRLSDLRKLCGMPEIEALVDRTELKVEIRDDLVYLTLPCLQPVIDREIAALAGLLGQRVPV
jgi:hypothetical protein